MERESRNRGEFRLRLAPLSMALVAAAMAACAPEERSLADAKTLRVSVQLSQMQLERGTFSQLRLWVDPGFAEGDRCVFGADLKASINSRKLPFRMWTPVWDGNGDECIAAVLTVDLPIPAHRPPPGDRGPAPAYEWDRVRIWDSSGEVSLDVRELLGLRSWAASSPEGTSELTMESAVEFGLSAFGEDLRNGSMYVCFGSWFSCAASFDETEVELITGQWGTSGLRVPAPNGLEPGTKGSYSIRFDHVPLAIRSCGADSCDGRIDLQFEDPHLRELVP